jgi:hypothetical protein
MSVEKTPTGVIDPYSAREVILYEVRDRNDGEAADNALVVAARNLLQATGLEKIIGRRTMVRDIKTGSIVEKVESGILMTIAEEFPDAKEEVVRDLFTSKAGFRYRWDNDANEVLILVSPFLSQPVFEIRGEERYFFGHAVAVSLKGTVEPFYTAVKDAFARPLRRVSEPS